jgi:hypothetical protein
MGVVNFSGGWYPFGPVTTPYYANAGRHLIDSGLSLYSCRIGRMGGDGSLGPGPDMPHSHDRTIDVA